MAVAMISPSEGALAVGSPATFRLSRVSRDRSLLSSTLPDRQLEHIPFFQGIGSLFYFQQGGKQILGSHFRQKAQFPHVDPQEGDIERRHVPGCPQDGPVPA